MFEEHSKAKPSLKSPAILIAASAVVVLISYGLCDFGGLGIASSMKHPLATYAGILSFFGGVLGFFVGLIWLLIRALQ